MDHSPIIMEVPLIRSLHDERAESVADGGFEKGRHIIRFPPIKQRKNTGTSPRKDFEVERRENESAS
jgi:hypothetical protein